MHECFEGPLMFKYLRTSSVQGFERLWIWGNMNPSFFKFPPPPPRPKMFSLPMSSPPPSFIIYQNISLLIKPHAWVFQYIFIFSSLRMQSVQDSEWLQSTQRCWSRWPKMWYKFDRRLVQILGRRRNAHTYTLPTDSKMWNGHAWVDGRSTPNSWRRSGFQKSLLSWLL